MDQSAVFPSNAVARWIDAEPLERERDPMTVQALDAARRHADMELRQVVSRAPQLRYRPFERLSSVQIGKAS